MKNNCKIKLLIKNYGMKNSTKIIMLLFTFSILQNLSYAQISGTKTIGGTTPDYTTINNAITALKASGINGNVTFNIRDGVYNEILDISNISGSETYGIIFQSESQDTSKVKITYTASVGNTYLVNLTKIKNITFKNISFRFTGNYTCRMVNMYDSVVNIKFQNNYFKCLNTSAYIIYAAQPASGEKAPRLLELTNNTFESGYSAIELYGGYYGIINNLIITSNIFKGQKNNGVYLSSCQGISIKSNLVNSITSTYYDVSAFGIGIEYGKDFEVSNNTVYSSFCYGIMLKGCSNTSLLKRTISNNFVTTKIDPNGMSGQAMHLETTTYADIVYNSLRLIGGNTGMTSYGLSVSGCSNINVVNNIIHNNETYAVSLDSKTGITTWDYNYLFGSSTYFAGFNSTSYTSLATWQAASTLDVHSVTGTLTFVSASDLHVNSAIVNDKGALWASVSTDIDNETRSSTTPDIGADEFTIVNHAPVIANQTFAKNENLANGSAMGTVLASDPDAGQTLTYSITGGNTSNAFVINSSTGAITVNTSSALNYETTPSFSLTVSVLDNGTSPLSSSATITVNLTNINEAPVIANQTFTINENSANGSAVGTVLASDPDAGQTLTYSISGGNTSNAFLVNSSTGAITVNTSSALNYEATPSFALTLSVLDNGTTPLSSSATITVDITNVNEAPVIVNQTFAINEKSVNSSAVGTVLASDPDAGQSLTYSITGGNTSNAFVINSSTGAITVNTSSALIYETTPSFALTVSVLDNGTTPLSNAATITVNLNKVTGVNSLSYDQSLLIYPNPSNGTISIKGDYLSNNKIEIQVYDITGKLVLRLKNVSVNESINLSDLSGIFNIKVLIDNKTYNQKIIIQK